jgi:hypothetical protein
MLKKITKKNFYTENFKMSNPDPVNRHQNSLDPVTLDPISPDLVSPDLVNPTGQTPTKQDPATAYSITGAVPPHFRIAGTSSLTGCETTPKEEGASSNLLHTSAERNPGKTTRI